MKRVVVGALIFFSALFITQLVSADLTCTITTSCADTPLLYFENTTGGSTNAHAQLANYTNYCYQEFANESTTCGALSTGSYDTGAGWTTPSNIQDGDFDTGSTASDGSTFDINYTKPAQASYESTWEYRTTYASSTVVWTNLTLPTACWNQQPLQLRIEYTAPSGFSGVDAKCYNGSAYETIEGYVLNTAGVEFNEEAMNWEFGYQNALCCSSTTQTVENTCSAGTTILQLSNQTNAHVQTSNYTNYTYNACLSGTGRALCYATTSASCDTNYVKTVSIDSSEGSPYTNAHVADPDHYPVNVCCYLNSLPTHSTPILNASDAPANTSEANLTVYPQNGNDVDGNLFRYVYDWQKDSESTAQLILPMDINESETTAGLINDYSTFNNDAQLGDGYANKVPVWTENCVAGGCYEFDGDSMITLPQTSPSPFDAENVSVSLWFKTSTTTESWFVQNYQNSGNRWVVGLADYSGGTSPFVATSTNTGENKVTATNFNDNSWHHVVFLSKQNYSEMEIYVDGTLQSTLTLNEPFASTANDQTISIGAATDEASVTAAEYNGLLDEIYIFNYTLSPEYIQNLYASGNANSTQLAAQETSPGETWTVDVTPVDKYDAGITRTTNSVTLVAPEPDTPTPIYPVNTSITDREPVFNWSSVTDPKGGTINYEVNVTAPISVNCFDFQENVTDSNVTSPIELCTDMDYNTDSFEWIVRACNDVGDCSAWSNASYFNVSSVNSFSLVNNAVNFGNVTPEQRVNTSDDSPSPFEIRNEGNIRVNITGSANESILDSVDLNSSYFQFAPRLSEGTAYNTTRSPSTYQNVLNISTVLMQGLQYQNTSDEAYVDIAVEVPFFEPPGSKSTTITFTSTPTNNP